MLCDPFRDRSGNHWLFSSELSGNHWLLSSELLGNHWLLSSELSGNHWLFSSELSGNHWLFTRCSAKDVSYASAEVHLALGGALLVRYATPATLSGPRVSTAGQRCGRTGRATSWSCCSAELKKRRSLRHEVLQHRRATTW